MVRGALSLGRLLDDSGRLGVVEVFCVGVDHEKVGGAGCVFAGVFCTGCVEVLGSESQIPFVLVEGPWDALPYTNLSKASSPVSPAPFVPKPPTEPKDMKSSDCPPSRWLPDNS